MAKGKSRNPLDRFVTYAYHFELHAASSYDKFDGLAINGANDSTKPREANGTLLINTRKDAHQTIDNVRFDYISQGAHPAAGGIASTVITFTVTEPGGMFFVEKLAHLANDNQVEEFAHLVFALKIIFVGRDEDNKIVEMPVEEVIPMAMAGFDAQFNHMGGLYSLSFVAAAHSATSSGGILALTTGTINKSISIKAKTVKEALHQLQEKLNSNYHKIYENELKSEGKKVRYIIKYNLGIDGKLSGINKDSFAKDEYVIKQFNAGTRITDMIRSIITSSEEINKEIAKSTPNLTKEGHPDVMIPTYSAGSLLLDNELQLIFTVDAYRGGGKTYEFDYLFSNTMTDPNVDVLAFDVRVPEMFTVPVIEVLGAQAMINQDGEVPGKSPLIHSQNGVTPDKTQETLPLQRDQKLVDGGPNSIAYNPIATNAGRDGYIDTPHDKVKAKQMAFEATTRFAGATGMQFKFLIRGHFDILRHGISTPDGSTTAFGATSGLWMKVNIKDAEGRPFYYQGYYWVFAVTNIFQGGMFTQEISCAIMDDATYMAHPSRIPQ